MGIDRRDFAAAVRYHQSGNLLEAESIYHRILDHNPRHADALHLLGVIAHQRGDEDPAIERIRRAIGLDPSDPRYHGNLGVVHHTLGDLELAERDYREALRLAPDFADARNNLGLILHGLGRHAEASVQYREALRCEPDSAQTHNNFGQALEAQGQAADALIHYREAIRLKPDYAEAQNNLGVVLQDRGELPEALEHYQQAVCLKPDYIEAHNNLGSVLQAQGQQDAALAHYRQALRLKPDYAEAHSNLGLLRQAQGRLQDALASLEEAIRLDPECVSAQWNRALIWLLLGDFSRGWPGYEWRWKHFRLPAQPFPQPRWDGSPLAGRTILLYWEQGLGDTLQFVRYASLVKERGGSVLVVCQPSLARLLETCPGVDMVIAEGMLLPHFDVQVPLLSLPEIFQSNLASIPAGIPYLAPPQHVHPELEAALAASPPILRVGIVWAGNPEHKNDRNRSCLLAHFRPLTRVPDVALFSLQKGLRAVDLHDQTNEFAITDLSQFLGDFGDTAAAIARLDLVVTVDTAVAHLAGALGKPVWLLLPFAPDWRWLLEREDSPWYPSMRLFRQTRSDDWIGVIARVGEALVTAVGSGDVARVTARRTLVDETQTQSAPRTQPAADEENVLTLAPGFPIAPAYDEPARPGAPAVPAAPISMIAVERADLTRTLAAVRGSDGGRWADPANLSPAWDGRAARVAERIPRGTHVLDVGAGAMALRRFLDRSVRYTPADIVAREPGCLVVDLNQGQFPEGQYDYVTMLGVLEYVHDVAAVLRCARRAAPRAIFTYSLYSGEERDARRALGWFNDYTARELTTLLAESGWQVTSLEAIENNQVILTCRDGASSGQCGFPTLPDRKRILVMGYHNAANFGDRLGYHLIPGALPPHCDVSFGTFHPWRVPEGPYDLVIVGIGNSLFGPLLTDDLQHLVEAAPYSIGVFGTQYRDTLPVDRLHRLVSALTHWYARYEEDIFLYGNGHHNVRHMGDWLALICPMGTPSLDKELVICPNFIASETPLDRVIQDIQSYQRVHSARIHPLLVALHSAQVVSYEEQREMGDGQISGKFRSLLLDVFEKSYPEREPFTVNRHLVSAYQTRVRANYSHLSAAIRTLLGDGTWTFGSLRAHTEESSL